MQAGLHASPICPARKLHVDRLPGAIFLPLACGGGGSGLLCNGQGCARVTSLQRFQGGARDEWSIPIPLLLTSVVGYIALCE